MTHATVNADLDTITHWFPGDPSQNNSEDNSYLDLINDMIVGFYKEGAYGATWSSVSLPASPSDGKWCIRSNTDVSELRYYIYNGGSWEFAVVDTIDDDNYAKLDATQTFSGDNTFSGLLYLDGISAGDGMRLQVGTSAVFDADAGTPELLFRHYATNDFGGAVTTLMDLNFDNNTVDILGNLTVTTSAASATIPLLLENTSTDAGAYPTLQFKDPISSSAWDSTYANKIFGSIDFYTSDASSGGVGVLGSIRAQNTGESSTTPYSKLIFSAGSTATFKDILSIEDSGIEIDGNLTIVNQGAGTNPSFASNSGGQILTLTGELAILDSKNLYIGSGADLRLYHNVSASFIDNYTGILYLRNNQGGAREMRSYSSNFRKYLTGDFTIQDTDDSDALLLEFDTSAREFKVGTVSDPVTTSLSSTTIFAGLLRPDVDGTQTIGSSAFAFSEIYVDISTTGNAANVYLASTTGQFLRSTSSMKYKENILDLEIDTSLIYDLRPTSYNSLGEHDDKNKRFFGLIAEEVADIIPELVDYDDEGRPDGVAYPMLSVLQLQEMKNLKDDNMSLLNRVETLELELTQIKEKLK